MKRGAKILLGDILEAAELLAQYTRGVSFEDFSTNIEKQDSVARRLEIIGEAVKRLPQSLARSSRIRRTTAASGCSG